ncbi:MAG: hypothetical protein HY895_11625 [Deltaproteobacteria bacterium]|nr:hypothetical protein [Deltaproteobacteria bacterium]
MNSINDILRDGPVPAGGTAAADPTALAAGLIQNALQTQIRRAKKQPGGDTQWMLVNMEEYQKRNASIFREACLIRGIF